MKNLSELTTNRNTKKLAISKVFCRLSSVEPTFEELSKVRDEAHAEFQVILKKLVAQFGSNDCLSFPVSFSEYWSQWQTIKIDPKINGYPDNLEFEQKQFIILYEVPKDVAEYLIGLNGS
jgi:hypothetical protein